MMTKYHINPETGNPGICKAVNKCRFGESTQHFGTKWQAMKAFEEGKISISESVTKKVEKNIMDNFTTREDFESLISDVDGGKIKLFKVMNPGAQTTLVKNEITDPRLFFKEVTHEFEDKNISWGYAGTLQDGRYFFSSMWADYTFAGGDLYISDDWEYLTKMAMTKEERKLLGIE